MSNRLGRLLRQRDFRLVWIGEATSMLGTEVTAVAMPLVAVTVLHASAFAVGVLAAAVWLPWVLIGLPAGAWVDRLARRRLMVTCDAVSVLLLASVPVAAWFGILTLAHLLAVALLTGVAAVFLLTAFQVFLPAVVRAEQLPQANAMVQGSESVARVGGPGVGGLLAQLFGAVTGLLADAVSFVVSGVCLLRVREHDRPAGRPDGRGLRAEITGGLRFVLRDPYIRLLTVYSGVGNLAGSALQAITVVFLVRAVGVSPAAVGGLLTASGIGGIVGALLATRFARRVGTARAILLGEAVTIPFILLVPLTTTGPGVLLFITGILVTDAGVTVSNVVIASFRQRYVPRALLGRVTTSTRFVSYGAMPLGALLGGLAADQLGLRTGVWLACAAQTLAVTILFTSSTFRRRRDLPTTEHTSTTTTAS